MTNEGILSFYFPNLVIHSFSRFVEMKNLKLPALSPIQQWQQEQKLKTTEFLKYSIFNLQFSFCLLI